MKDIFRMASEHCDYTFDVEQHERAKCFWCRIRKLARFSATPSKCAVCMALKIGLGALTVVAVAVLLAMLWYRFTH